MNRVWHMTMMTGTFNPRITIRTYNGPKSTNNYALFRPKLYEAFIFVDLGSTDLYYNTPSTHCDGQYRAQINSLRRHIMVVLAIPLLLVAAVVIMAIVVYDSSSVSMIPSSMLRSRQLMRMPQTVVVKVASAVHQEDDISGQEMVHHQEDKQNPIQEIHRDDQEDSRTYIQDIRNQNQDVQEMHHEKHIKQFRCGDRVVPGEKIHKACRAPTPTEVLPMAAIVQAFNHAKQAVMVVEGLASQSNMKKIIVFEDGSTDDSLEAYQEAIAGVPHAEVISGGNVHEIRNYNRGMEQVMKESPEIELFALMQDDDVLTTKNDDWGPRASELFERHPQLCVLGGYVGWSHLKGGSLKGTELYGNEPSYNKNLEKEPITRMCGNQHFRFVAAIASSPMILRKSCVQELGLLSGMTSEPGEPGILFDVEYSLRAWTSTKWQVGLYRTGFTHGVGGHASMRDKEKRQIRKEVGNHARHWLVEHYKGASLHCKYESEGSGHQNMTATV